MCFIRQPARPPPPPSVVRKVERLKAAGGKPAVQVIVVGWYNSGNALGCVFALCSVKFYCRERRRCDVTETRIWLYYCLDKWRRYVGFTRYGLEGHLFPDSIEGYYFKTSFGFKAFVVGTNFIVVFLDRDKKVITRYHKCISWI